jgi:hypothetical protein
MSLKLLLCLALGLGACLFTHRSVAQVPERTSPPAAKDAYVSAQLAKLFEGAPVRVVLRRAFNRWLLLDATATDGHAQLTNALAVRFSISLFGFTNEAAAREEFQQESSYFASPAAVTNAGYDELYSDHQGRLIGRHGASVVLMNSGPPEQCDAVLRAIAKNLSANRALLPDLVQYAYTMHFGELAPLQAGLSKLNARVSELSPPNFAATTSRYGDNSVTAYFTGSGNSEVEITAKAYDSEEAAKTGHEEDQMGISVHWSEKKIIGGVEVYEYANYGRVDFHVGPYAFDISTIRLSADSMQPLLLKVSSALIAEFGH